MALPLTPISESAPEYSTCVGLKAVFSHTPLIVHIDYRLHILPRHQLLLETYPDYMLFTWPVTVPRDLS